MQSEALTKWRAIICTHKILAASPRCLLLHIFIPVGMLDFEPRPHRAPRVTARGVFNLSARRDTLRVGCSGFIRRRYHRIWRLGLRAACEGIPKDAPWQRLALRLPAPSPEQ
jgi:hypothetical protein